MKQYKVFIYLFCIVLGCTKELNINLNESEKKIVLYPILTNNKAIVIKMSATTGVTSNSFPKLENAIVVITEDNIPVDTVKINAKGKGTSKVTAKSGSIYGFNASSNNYVQAICNAQLPAKPEIISVDTSQISKIPGDQTIKIRLRIKEDLASINYYKVSITQRSYRISQKQRGIPPNYVFYDSTYFSYWDCDIKSNSKSLDFFYYRGTSRFMLAKEKELFADGGTYISQYGSETYYNGNDFYYSNFLSHSNEITINIILWYGWTSFTKNDKFLIDVTSVGADYYKGVKSYANYGTVQSDNLPLSEEVSIYSAVKGGYGFPLAYYSVIDSSIVGQADLPK